MKIFDSSLLNEEIAKFKSIFQNDENDNIKYYNKNNYSNISQKDKIYQFSLQVIKKIYPMKK